MSVITVKRDSGGVRALTVTDHASSLKGEDNTLVCAALSVLITTCANAIEEITGLDPATVRREEPVEISVTLPDGIDERKRHDARVVLHAILRGMTDVAQSNPDYVTIIDGRVSSC